MPLKSPSFTIAIFLTLSALACFVLIDATVKFWAAHISVIATVWFRYVFQAISMACVMGVKKVPFTSHHYLLHVIRAALMITVSITGTLSVVMMPIGEFAAIVMLNPLVVVLISAVYFKEHVSLLRWGLLLMGFLGAILVIDPGTLQLGWYTLLPISTVFAYAAYSWMTNHMARFENPLAMHFSTGLIGSLALALALPLIWQPIENPAYYLIFLLIGLSSTIAHFMLLMAFAIASPSRISAILYFQIPLAVLAGWLIFDHLPSSLAWLGIGLIVFSGVACAHLSQPRSAAA